MLAYSPTEKTSLIIVAIKIAGAKKRRENIKAELKKLKEGK
jgi:hypothetical protein